MTDLVNFFVDERPVADDDMEGELDGEKSSKWWSARQFPHNLLAESRMRRRVMRTLARTDADIGARIFSSAGGPVELPVWAMRLAAESGRDIQVVSGWVGTSREMDALGEQPPTYKWTDASVVITLRSAGSNRESDPVWRYEELWQRGTESTDDPWVSLVASDLPEDAWRDADRNPGTTATVSISADWGFAIVHLLNDLLQALVLRNVGLTFDVQPSVGCAREHHRYFLGHT